MQDDRYWVYILENPSGRIYIGYTNNITRRLNEHNDPFGPMTKQTLKNEPDVNITV